MKQTIAVMFGGKSAEHEVSVITGVQAINALDKNKYEVLPIYVSKEGKWFSSKDFYQIETFKNLNKISELANEVYFKTNEAKKLFVKSKGLVGKVKEVEIEVAILCFHGGLGENGGFQGLLEILDIPYSGSGILGSTVGMDKAVMKQVLAHSGINISPYIYFYEKEWKDYKSKIVKDIKILKLPVFVKPANCGSSIGISKVKNWTDLENAIEVALAFDRKIIVEQGIENLAEINVSVMGIDGDEVETSVCEQVFCSQDFLNYNDKYVGGGKSKGMASTSRKVPAELSKKAKSVIEETAKKAFHALNASGLVRIDFLINDKTQEYYLIEINTIPGSLSFYLWKESGLSFDKMLDKMIELAIKRKKITQKMNVFSSNILENANLRGSKGAKN